MVPKHNYVIDAPPPLALWIWKMPRAAMGRPRPRATLSGLGRPMASLGIFHIHRASGGGASISHSEGEIPNDYQTQYERCMWMNPQKDSDRLVRHLRHRRLRLLHPGGPQGLRHQGRDSIDRNSACSSIKLQVPEKNLFSQLEGD